jgi:hypothetical protein
MSFEVQPQFYHLQYLKGNAHRFYHLSKKEKRKCSPDRLQININLSIYIKKQKRKSTFQKLGKECITYIIPQIASLKLKFTCVKLKQIDALTQSFNFFLQFYFHVINTKFKL